MGWYVRSDAKDVVGHLARVDDLKEALVAAGLPTKGKRAELLAVCLEKCPEWVINFSKNRPGYRCTDKGVIELQATKPERPLYTKENLMSQHREYFDRDVNDARKSNFILGIKIYANTHEYWMEEKCPKAAQFIGLYLPDEVPELYPDDCPAEYACSCVCRDMILSSDSTDEAMALRARNAERGLPEPPPTWEQQKAEVEAMEAKRFEGKPEELKAHRSLVKRIVDSILGR